MEAKEIKSNTMAPIKPYPIPDSQEGHHPHYARMPKKVTQEDVEANKFSPGFSAKVGSWVAVNITPGKLVHLFSPVPFTTRKACQRACDIHNQFNGWDAEAVNQIIADCL